MLHSSRVLIRRLRVPEQPRFCEFKVPSGGNVEYEARITGFNQLAHQVYKPKAALKQAGPIMVKLTPPNIRSYLSFSILIK